MSNPISVTSISNSFLLQSQSQQTQRVVDQATQTARTLRQQAKDARAEADRAQATAFSLELKASEAQATATQASLNLQAASSFENAQANLQNLYSNLPHTIALNTQAHAPTPGSTSTTATGSTPAVGTLIDTTA